MKKIATIILIILVLGIGGYLFSDYSSKPKMLSYNSEPVSTCKDTDGTNRYERGYSEYTLPNGTEYATADVCDFSQQFSKKDVGVVREGYCDGNNFKTELWSCGRGSICRVGRCINGNPRDPICSDTDGGMNEKVRGSVIDVASNDDGCWTSPNRQNPELGGAYAPSCTNSTEVGCYVHENYCDTNDQKQYKIIACPNG